MKLKACYLSSHIDYSVGEDAGHESICRCSEWLHYHVQKGLPQLVHGVAVSPFSKQFPTLPTLTVCEESCLLMLLTLHQRQRDLLLLVTWWSVFIKKENKQLLRWYIKILCNHRNNSFLLNDLTKASKSPPNATPYIFLPTWSKIKLTNSSIFLLLYCPSSPNLHTYCFTL